MGTYEGFTFKSRKAGAAVAIFRHGRLAKSLSGDEAAAFLSEVGDPPSQELMARLSGNVRDGDEPGIPLRITRDQDHRGPQGR